jgi:O-antigen ligase
MKDLFVIKDSVSNKISYYLIILFILFLPLDRFYDEILLIILLANTLVNPRKLSRDPLTLPVMAFIAIYLISVVGTVYSAYKQQAYFELEKKLGIILFPLILMFNRMDLNKYRLNFLKFICISCTVTVLFLFLDALQTIHYLKFPISSVFSSKFLNQNFSSPIGIHATYLSMYVCLSISVLIYLITNERNRTMQYAFILSLLILVAGLFQLSSRAVLISFLVIINICFPMLLIKKSVRKKYVLSTGLFTLALFMIFSNMSSYRSRFMTEFVADLSQSGLNVDVIEPRAVRWQSAMKLIDRAPFTGYGNGAEIPVLKEQYFKDRLFDSYLNQLNAHNQYISFLLQEGIAGLIIYLFTLYAGFAKSLRQKDFIFLCFLVIITVVSFSENILDTNKGVFFFSLFFSLFLLTNGPDILENSKKNITISPT